MRGTNRTSVWWAMGAAGMLAVAGAASAGVETTTNDGAASSGEGGRVVETRTERVEDAIRYVRTATGARGTATAEGEVARTDTGWMRDGVLIRPDGTVVDVSAETIRTEAGDERLVLRQTEDGWVIESHGTRDGETFTREVVAASPDGRTFTRSTTGERTEDGGVYDTVRVGPDGRVVTSAGEFVRTESGWVRTATHENENGGTLEREVEVARDDEGATRTVRSRAVDRDGVERGGGTTTQRRTKDGARTGARERDAPKRHRGGGRRR